ncbi:hypothetical protein ACQKMV_15190 [Lysinibacillus sp. NPDC094403]|uniref:hypothetical protein n=1 Tax=Lysinibacillus sp. NPDC094403 TaxID=3390581 RepID=UPI003D013F6D
MNYLAFDYENPQEEERLKMFRSVHTYISKFVINFTAKDLHQDIVVNGSILYKKSTLQEIRVYVEENLHLLWSEYKRTMNPEEYPVYLSQACWDNEMTRNKEIKGKVTKMMNGHREEEWRDR